MTDSRFRILFHAGTNSFVETLGEDMIFEACRNEVESMTRL
jgi:hypothetical protein